MMSAKPLLLCLLLASPAAFAGNLSCHESPKSTGNPELDAIVTRYECRYTGSLQQAYSAFMKQKRKNGMRQRTRNFRMVSQTAP